MSHLIARSSKGLALPVLALEIATFARLDGPMDRVGGGSAAPFDTVVGGTPFALAVRGRFLDEA